MRDREDNTGIPANLMDCPRIAEHSMAAIAGVGKPSSYCESEESLQSVDKRGPRDASKNRTKATVIPRTRLP